MKLEYVYKDLSLLLAETNSDHDSIIKSVAFDTRRIVDGDGVLFFALEGNFRNGHDFIDDAYQKGVRHFVVKNSGVMCEFKDAHEIVVNDTFNALQKLAKHHRSKFNCPIVAITGSNGKTTVKEWLAQLLSPKYNVARSPKSYNSKLGVCLSLLELSHVSEIGIVEVGVAEAGEMKEMAELIQPSFGVLTSFGHAHRELFSSAKEHLDEKLNLFQKVDKFLYPDSIHGIHAKNACAITENSFEDILNCLNYTDPISKQNARLAIAMALELGLESRDVKIGIGKLESLALRLETYDGLFNNSIINDTYNLDLDSLRHSLEYQVANSNGKNRIVLIGLTSSDDPLKPLIEEIITEFNPSEYHFHIAGTPFNFDFKNSNILIKGSRNAKMETIAANLKQQNHQTYLEIDLKSIRQNINYYKELLDPETKVLCMVKAASYGSDAEKMGGFLEGIGVDYLGVAYIDEGVELREKGVQIPILVMNCESSGFAQCIDYNLEPAIYALAQLDSFIKELINRSLLNYPIHIKLETGMNRLGFTKDMIPALIKTVEAQPEVLIKSIYSHLAESDDPNSSFVRYQIDEFSVMADSISNEFAYPILLHILNSGGIVNYTSAQFDMVRLGIGMYGSVTNSRLRPSISWYSSVSQIKQLTKGDSVGYGRSFVADKDLSIAIVPVGYADGFRRSLGKGVGGVYIDGTFCPTVGEICMDMIMINVSDINCSEGQKVEIIGPHQTISELAAKLNTIPYEVMTSFSKRLHRVYIDQ